MSTEFFNDQWRIPSNENQNKVSNYSMEFDGTSTEIDLGSSVLFDSTKGFSVSAWVNLTSYSPQYPIIIKIKTDQSTDFIFGLSSASSYAGVIIGSSSNFVRGKTTGNISGDFIGTWKHVCLTFDGVDRTALSSYKIYVDGSSVTLISTGLFGAISNANSKIGTSDYASNRFNGKIDQVSVFDYGLSATQVSNLYGGGTAITNPMSLSPKPIAYYQLGDQSVYNGANLLVPNNSLSDFVFNFDGASSEINLGTSVILNSSSAFSFSSWVNLENYTNYAYPYIVKLKTSATNGWRIMLSQSSGYEGITIGNSGSFAQVRTSGNISQDFLNSWNHIAVTYNGSGSNTISNWKIYVNGSSVSLITSGVIGSDTNTSFIGSGNGQRFFIGKISNVSIFDTELSSTQITTLYNNGAPGDISSLSPTHWYKLNAADTFDGSNWTINDYGSGGNDGTSSGMDSSSLVVSTLQQINGFSPYALSLDGINDVLTIQNSSTFNLGTSFTISGWFNFSSNKYQGLISFDATSGGSPRGWFLFQISSSNDIKLFDGTNIFTLKTSYTTTNQWDSFIITYDGTDLVFYINGNQESTQAVSVNLQTNGNDAQIGNNQFASGRFFEGKMSNIALWNVGLTSTQVTEIYNEGVPSNLNNFSGTAPVAWWQIGSNSSFNTNWTCLDEIGTNNAVSAGNMTNDDIVDGVGYSESGLGTSSIDIKGDAPYSTANGLSENMDVLDRTTDVPS